MTPNNCPYCGKAFDENERCKDCGIVVPIGQEVSRTEYPDLYKAIKETFQKSKSMTPEAQRIAIAEACGWTLCPRPNIKPLSQKVWRKGKENKTLTCLPNYLTDLNAMHVAEKVLTEDLQMHFSWMLVQVVANFSTWKTDEYEHTLCWEMGLTDIWDCLAATATQRAEAFLRTLGLWKD